MSEERFRAVVPEKVVAAPAEMVPYTVELPFKTREWGNFVSDLNTCLTRIGDSKWKEVRKARYGVDRDDVLEEGIEAVCGRNREEKVWLAKELIRTCKELPTLFGTPESVLVHEEMELSREQVVSLLANYALNTFAMLQGNLADEMRYSWPSDCAMVLETVADGIRGELPKSVRIGLYMDVGVPWKNILQNIFYMQETPPIKSFGNVATRELPCMNAERWKAFESTCLSYLSDVREDTNGGDILAALRVEADQKCRDNSGLVNVFREMEQEHGLKLANRIVKVALDMPQLFPFSVLPYFPAKRAASAMLSRKQVCCLICNAVLETFSFVKWNRYFNFQTLCATSLFANSPAYHPYIKGVIHYLDRTLLGVGSLRGFISFTRVVIDHKVAPEKCKEKIVIPTFREGSIEECSLCDQLDFANKHLGGAVLGMGAVQEEIRFGIMNPELLSGMLMFETMEDNEAIHIEGIEQFATYKGYGRGLEWGENFIDESPRSDNGSFLTRLIAIDALKYETKEDQFEKAMINREILKAYAGFSEEGFMGNVGRPVATGRWGCGVFNGNTNLKFIIQWIACSMLHREMVFHYFRDDEEWQTCRAFVEDILSGADKVLTVADLYKYIFKNLRGGRNDCLVM